MAEVCTRYARAQRVHNFQGGDPQAPRSHSVWGDFLMESLLESLQPKIESAVGLTLLPTYAFYRVYVPNEVLHPHKDRRACEVSCTLCLGYDYQGKDFRWRIRMGDKAIAMQPGDAVAYLGCEIDLETSLAIPQVAGMRGIPALCFSDRPNRKKSSWAARLVHAQVR
jgi:hypothetical protein